MENNIDKKVNIAILYLITTLLCLAAISFVTIIGSEGHPLVKPLLYAITVFQLAGLIYNIEINIENENIIIKIYKKLHIVSTIIVIVCFTIILRATIREYHTVIVPNAIGNISNLPISDIDKVENSYVYETEDFYLLFPKYSKIKHVVKDEPLQSDDNITFCGAATFQRIKEFAFHHENIAGLHAESGELHEGYDLENVVAFSYYDGKANFDMTGNDESIKLAAENGGSGFMQFPLIIDGEYSLKCWKGLSKYRCYRALTSINNKICIVDCKKQIAYKEFIDKILELGIEDAIYLDMGLCSYSWYRNENGKATKLFKVSSPYSHNWIVFEK